MEVTSRRLLVAAAVAMVAVLGSVSLPASAQPSGNSDGDLCVDPLATCPNCTRPFQCLADPCRVSRCRAQPGAECRSDLCVGCSARFFHPRGSGAEVTASCNTVLPCRRRGGYQLPTTCDWGSRGSCPGDEAASYCDVDPFGSFSTCCCNRKVGSCPGCTRPRVCPAPPCRSASCPSFPDAHCRADLCKGCQPFFVDASGNDVTDQCSSVVTPCARRGGVNMNVSCSAEGREACPAKSYCDVDPRRAFSTCCCPETTICAENPCNRGTCPAYPNARCVQKCGSCDALFFTEEGRDVTSSCYNVQPCARHGGTKTGRTCWPGSSRQCSSGSYCDRFSGFAECCCSATPCSPRPCDSASCPAYPGATCTASLCEGCAAKFSLAGRDVTTSCCGQEGFTFRSGVCYDNRCLPGNVSACTRRWGRCWYNRSTNTKICSFLSG